MRFELSPEVEIANEGQDAASIHADLQDLPGVAGVTISGGRVYVTFAKDTDLTVSLQLLEAVKSPPVDRKELQWSSSTSFAISASPLP